MTTSVTAGTTTDARDGTGDVPRLVDLTEWDADWSRREDHYELVAGIPTVVPSEVFDNRQAGSWLVRLLDRAFGDAVRVVTDYDLELSQVPATVRCPDVVVLARHLGQDRRAQPEDVLLVAEVVSPSSTVTDWRHKRDEYAAAGIPLYLVIDLRPEVRTLALFAEPRDGVYADAADRRGAEVTFTLHEKPVTIRLADLLR